MLTLSIPGSASVELHHLVLDFNGTIAKDGELLAAAADRLTKLTEILTVHVITADTHGTVQQKLAGLPCSLHIIPPGSQDRAKQLFIEKLGWEGVVALGNGRNDSLMLHRAVLGIGIIGPEGGSAEMMRQADLVVTSIEDGLDLLLCPDRLRATLRN